MSIFFTNYPIISYNGVNVRDITRRINFIETNLSNPYIFLPYTVKEGERPEDIAYQYYGTVDATWVVMLANNLTDPYHDWPISSDLFDAFIISKYTELSGKTGNDVIAWTQDETNLDNVLYYYTTTALGNKINVSPDTFALVYDGDVVIGRDVAAGYIAYRIYNYEQDLNENKREILIIEKQYYAQIDAEFRILIK